VPGRTKTKNIMRIKYKKGSINLEGSRKKKQNATRNKDYCWIAKIRKRMERGDVWKGGKQKRKKKSNFTHSFSVRAGNYRQQRIVKLTP